MNKKTNSKYDDADSSFNRGATSSIIENSYYNDDDDNDDINYDYDDEASDDTSSRFSNYSQDHKKFLQMRGKYLFNELKRTFKYLNFPINVSKRMVCNYYIYIYRLVGKYCYCTHLSKISFIYIYPKISITRSLF